MRYCITAVRMAIIKRQEISVDNDVKKEGTLCTLGGNVNWDIHYGKQYGGSSKN